MRKAVIVGLGPLGRKIVRYAARRKSIAIIGAVDVDPRKIGQDLGSLCEMRRTKLLVHGTIRKALGRKKADVALLATDSSVKEIEPPIADLARAGLNIVSTCEELCFPYKIAPASARRIDAVCRRHDVTCLGVGVNPGFLMDFLPSILTAVNQNVKSITVKRFQDASSRRVPFQRKIGAGLTRTKFRKRKSAGTLRHVGLPESIYMIAHAMGWSLTKVSEILRPIIADKRITSGNAPISAGMASGVEQIGRGYLGRRPVITLHFRAAVGEPRSFDSVEIKGRPNLTSIIDGGVNGDIATCAIVLNAVGSVIAAKPGLKTMLEVPAVTFCD